MTEQTEKTKEMATEHCNRANVNNALVRQSAIQRAEEVAPDSKAVFNLSPENKKLFHKFAQDIIKKAAKTPQIPYYEPHELVLYSIRKLCESELARQDLDLSPFNRGYRAFAELVMQELNVWNDLKKE